MYFCGHLFRPCFLSSFLPYMCTHLGNSCTNIFDIWKAIFFYLFFFLYGLWMYGLWYGLYGIAFFGDLWMYFWETWKVSWPWESEGYHCFGEVRGIIVLGKCEGYHDFGKCEGYHGFGKMRDITILGVCMAWHGFMCGEHGLALLYLNVAWLGMALCVESMAWHGFIWRLHGLAWLWGLSGLTPARGPKSLNSEGSGLMPVWYPKRLGLMLARSPKSLNSEGSRLTLVWCPKRLRLMPAHSLKSLNSEVLGLTPVWCTRTGTYACTQPEKLNKGSGLTLQQFPRI